MKFSRSALLAALLVVLAAVLTYWSIHQLATLNTHTLGGLPATNEPGNDDAGHPLATLATAARWLALGALALVVAPRRSLTGWIVLSMLVGIELGHDVPAVALNLKVLSDAFLRLVKTIIAPLVFATLVVGIAGHANLKQVGRMGLKALVYFEVVTTFALLIGLAAINFTKAGVGIKHTAIAEKADALAAAAPQSVADIILHIFPENIAKSVAEGQVLQVVVFAIIFAIGVALCPEKPRRQMLSFCESLSEVMFKFTNVVMYFAPLGVGGAMAYTVAKLGFGPLLNAFQLLLTLYGALIAFVLLVLLPVALLMRIPLRRFVAAVAEPVSIAFATTSSEAALPRAMEAMEGIGVPRRIVAFVMPTGYSFNLDGTTLYLSLAAVFVAQAAGVPLSFGDQMLLVFTLMLTSKGVAGVPRASLVILLATLPSFNLPAWPVFIILGIDALMDMARTAVNVLGNCLASAVVARWEGEFIDNYEAPAELLAPEPLASTGH
jgi:proton glutamate symport protein